METVDEVELRCVAKLSIAALSHDGWRLFVVSTNELNTSAGIIAWPGTCSIVPS